LLEWGAGVAVALLALVRTRLQLRLDPALDALLKLITALAIGEIGQPR